VLVVVVEAGFKGTVKKLRLCKIAVSWISQIAVVHGSAGSYNYLHVEKPACPQKPLAELSSAPDYVSNSFRRLVW